MYNSITEILKKVHNSLKLRLKVINECIRSGDMEKFKIGFQVLRSLKFPVFPYQFVSKYRNMEVEVFHDKDGYPYVIHNGNKLYCKRKWDDSTVKKYYVSLQLEQDSESPHCYLTNKNRWPDEGDIIVDIGAAEGIFTLSIIDVVEKAYLFECDDEWRVPLEKTFSKWRQKIEIVQKYVGGGSKENCKIISLDEYFLGMKVDFLKADIEGAEELMLQGGIYTFNNLLKKVLICTYHTPNAETVIKSYLEKYGFRCEFNSGYMFFVNNPDTFTSPYVRHGIVYGVK